MNRLILIGLLLALAGCSGGGGSGAGGPQLLEGVWTGSRTDTVFICIIFICVADHEVTRPVMALATGDGTIHFLPWDVVNSPFPSGLFSGQFAGKVQITGNALSGTLRDTCKPVGGPLLFDHVAVQGFVTRRAVLDVEYEFDKCLGRGIFNLDFDMVSDQPASLAIVAGQWFAETVALNVGDDGTYTGATGTGCQLSGFITPASASFNVYEIDMTVENCDLDGSYSGLATTIVPDQFGTETLVISGLGSSSTIGIIVKR